MNPYRIEVLKSAQKSFSKLPKDIQARIVQKIDNLAINPYPTDTKKLKNGNGLFRVRVGDYRIIYKVQDNELVILIVKVAHRREVYD
ncbi:type II toxin-antitoxin system RelE/ParE family toxin [Synechocystis sp. PCC 7339]|uniref:type II toxin-antitoxin system RelE family toxin n=1 Tax=unclassified Synechocystis TaxID=2640012 RepID=UPI001BAF73C1|nr:MULTISPECIES: type II toxin-antitoxin system RelE/ParE family toxin [unclassified Synechocystis]QUS60092.1 type II toxin-antitoxin system RelE/ParE family toxin [Synechocystis sp. PCC 7338]UAJ72461.1 type II toxin-antitoxin system RelE/ParE family toxin [Synechocystis sp. PCC 7339]